MPSSVDDILSRPWAIVAILAGAFMLPLLLGDLFSGEKPKQVAKIAAVSAPRPAADRDALTIPDLRRAPALPGELAP